MRGAGKEGVEEGKKEVESNLTLRLNDWEELRQKRKESGLLEIRFRPHLTPVLLSVSKERY